MRQFWSCTCTVRWAFLLVSLFQMSICTRRSLATIRWHLWFHTWILISSCFHMQNRYQSCNFHDYYKSFYIRYQPSECHPHHLQKYLIAISNFNILQNSVSDIRSWNWVVQKYRSLYFNNGKASDIFSRKLRSTCSKRFRNRISKQPNCRKNQFQCY